jgi:hypothetical protein
LIACALGRRVRLLHLPPGLTLTLIRMLGLTVRDVILTREEIAGLMANLLLSHEPPRGRVRLADWMKENAARLGASYASELDRHFRGR